MSCPDPLAWSLDGYFAVRGRQIEALNQKELLIAELKAAVARCQNHAGLRSCGRLVATGSRHPRQGLRRMGILPAVILPRGDPLAPSPRGQPPMTDNPRTSPSVFRILGSFLCAGNETRCPLCVSARCGRAQSGFEVVIPARGRRTNPQPPRPGTVPGAPRRATRPRRAQEVAARGHPLLKTYIMSFFICAWQRPGSG